MSDRIKPFANFLDQLWENQRRRYGGAALDINAMDEIDPVHYRATQNHEREFDHDGDLGREYQDHMRDNHAGGGSSFVAPAWQQVAAALPVIEAPSIVAELPETEPVKTEGEL